MQLKFKLRLAELPGFSRFLACFAGNQLELFSQELTGIKGGGGQVCQIGIVKTAVDIRAPFDGTRSAPAARQVAGKRLAREWKTMEALIRVYCRGQHRDSGLCGECRQLLDYAQARLERCRFGTEKPTCANCPVHCYQRARREQIKTVMRHAGPRMLWRHPVLSLRHWWDGFRKAQAAGVE